MRTERIQTFYTRERSTTVQLFDTFKFRADKKHHWLQKACLNILQRLGCNASLTEVNIERLNVQPKSLIEGLMRQHAQHLQFCRWQPERVCMGPKEFHDLTGEVFNSNHTMTMRVPVELHENGNPKVLGMRITIIPWMEGILVVPTEKENNDSPFPRSPDSGRQCSRL